MRSKIMIRSAILLLVVAFTVTFGMCQSNVNEQQGLKPYDSLHGGDVDSVSLPSGSLSLHIGLAAFPQRGDIPLDFSLRYSSKAWQVKAKPSCYNPNCNPTYTFSWQPTRGISGAQIVSSLDWWIQTVATTDPSFNQTVSSPDGNVHQLTGSSTSATPLYPSHSLDATGILQLDANTLVMSNGTRYSYVNGIGNNLFAGKQPSSVTDANGNQITISSSGWTDTMGRVIPGTANLTGSNPQVQPGIPTSDLSTCPSGTSSAIVWNVPGVAGVSGGIRTFKFCYSMVTLSTNFQQGSVTEFPPNNTSLLTAIVLPDLTMWTLTYDSYGDITTLGFPTGGSISYTYATRAVPNCGADLTQTSRWVTSRTVNANDGTGGHTWNYSYTSTTTTVTSPEGNDTVHTLIAPVQSASCNLYDSQAQYFQGSSGSGTLLKTEATQFSGVASPYDVNGGPIAINVVPVQVTTTIGAKTSKIINTYDSGGTDANGNPYIFGNLLERDEYDFSNLLVRSTVNHYLWQDNATYKNNNFISLLASSTVRDGAGNQVAKASYGYDESTVAASGITTGLVSPPAGGNVRGNATTVSHWLNTTNSFISGTATYFDTGMKATTTDPLNHTISYTYSPTFAGAYMTQTNLPDTQMPDTGAPIVHHIVSGNYDFNTGLLTGFTDENNKTYSYNYDIMLRLSQGNHPDGGQTTFSYPDPNTVTRQRLISAGNYESSYTVKFDGVGRAYQTQQVTPTGTVLVDTTYDSTGRTSTVSNPYYSGSNHSTDPTYGIVSTQYDALSRVTRSTKQDGSIATITYNDNCTTTTDEAGKQRKVCTDALGRMTEVDEPNPNAAATYATGWAAVSGSEQSSGSSTSGTGSVTISAVDPSGGDQYYVVDPCADWGGSCPHNVYDTGTVSVTVNGYTTSTTYSGSDTYTSVASNLASAINNDSGAYVWASASGVTVSLTARSSGSGTNYSLSASSSSNDPTDFTPPSFGATTSGANLTGGHDPGYDNGTVRFTINGTNYTVSYGQGSTANGIASALASAINGDGNRVVNAAANGSTVNLTARNTGPVGDYSLSASYTWNSGSFSQPSFTTATSGGNLTGGYNSSDLTNNPYVTLYTYDTLGNLTCVEQHGAVSGTGCSASPSSDSSSPWRVRRFTYDSLTRLLTSKNPETGQISYSYDNAGNLGSKIEPMPNQAWGSSQTVTITYAYDALNRLTGKTYSDGTQNSAYRYDYSTYLGQTFANSIGRQVAATAANATINYFTSYDAMGRINKTTQCIPGVSACQTFTSSFDFLGDMLTLAYPNNNFAVTYTYDSALRLIQAADSNGATYAQTPVLLASGAIQEFTSPNFNNLKYHTDYNNRLQPTEIWTGTSSGSGALFDKQYSYNPPNTSQMNNGNIYTVTNVKDSSRAQTFTYDVLNRLSSAHDGTHWGNTYTYDPWGNMQKIPGSPAGENFQHAGDGNNHLVGFTYDAAGNMLNDGANSYTYDAENRITTAAGVTYTYDADSRRVKKSSGTNYWYGPGGNVLAETDSSGNWTNYIFFGGQCLARNIPQPAPNPPDIKYYVTDHLHSTAMFVDKAGTTSAIQDDNDFYPWGGVVSGVGKTTSNNTIKFTGKYRDTESQLDYFGARYYANASGRFLTPDWSGKPTTVPYASFGDPQSLNLYSYVRNSPIVRVDPDGHMVAGFTDSGAPLIPQGAGATMGDMSFGGGLPDDRYDVTTTTITTTINYGNGTVQTLTQTIVTIQQVGSSTVIAQGYGQHVTTTNTKPGSTGCYANGRAKIVGIPGKGFSLKRAFEQGLMHIGRIKHMFWTVRGSDGVEYDLSGGEDDKHRGFLGEWKTATNDPKEAKYRDSGKIIYTAPQTPDLCARVDAMEAAVDHWQFGQIQYHFFNGPNSNSSFNAIGQVGGMPLLAPFWTPGAKRLP